MANFCHLKFLKKQKQLKIVLSNNTDAASAITVPMTDFNANKFDKIRKKLKWVPARFRFKDWLYDKVMQVNTHRHLVKIE